MKRLVIGCGFLGFPLAKKWLAAGDDVFVTTRSTDRARQFAELKLHPLVLDTTDSKSLEQLRNFAFDTVVAAVGMDRSRYSDVHHVYVNGLKNVLANLNANVGQVIYVSSTGVYGDFDGGWVDETSTTNPQREGGKACLAAEVALQESQFSDRATILRMAGLYGNERIPTRASIESKRWDKLSASGYLNLIHVDDAVKAVVTVAEQKLLSEIFLVSDSSPTLRRDYYQFLADQFGFGEIPWVDHVLPDANSRGSSSKRISNRKLLETTGLQLQHPDFRSGLGDILKPSMTD